MPNIIDGNISLRQLIQNTYRPKFRSRFKYKNIKRTVGGNQLIKIVMILSNSFYF